MSWIEDEVPGGWNTIGGIMDIFSGVGGDYTAFLDAHDAFVDHTEPEAYANINDGNWINKESTRDWLYPLMTVMGISPSGNTSGETAVLDSRLVTGLLGNANSFLDENQIDDYEEWIDDNSWAREFDKISRYRGKVSGAIGSLVDGVFDNDQNISILGMDTGIQGWNEGGQGMSGMLGGLMGGSGGMGGMMGGMGNMLGIPAMSGGSSPLGGLGGLLGMGSGPTGQTSTLGGMTNGIMQMFSPSEPRELIETKRYDEDYTPDTWKETYGKRDFFKTGIEEEEEEDE